MAAVSNVVDLCDSSEEENVIVQSIVDLENRGGRGSGSRAGSSAASASSRFASGVARAPPPVLEIDDTDDDDEEQTSNRSKKRGRNGSTNIEIIDVEEDSKKPAAINGSRKRGRKNQQSTSTPPRQKQTPLEKIFEVFPDVDRTHANQLLVKHVHEIGMIMSVLAEGNYPKQKKEQGGQAKAIYTDLSSVILKRQQSIPQPKYDYLSQTSFEPSDKYREEAKHQLEYEFPYLKQKELRQLMTNYRSHYSLVRQHVHNLLTGNPSNKNNKSNNGVDATEEEEEMRYHILKNILASKKLTGDQQKRLGTTLCMKNPRVTYAAPAITDLILCDEIVHSDRKLQAFIDTVEERLSRMKARKHSQLDGSAMECSCCFEKVAMEEMVACRNEGHLFCVGCIKGYAENQIFSVGNLGIDKKTKKPSLELLCCHGDGCQSGFHEEHLKKALPFKTLEKYTQMQFQVAVEAAGLGENICSCPKCGFKADVPPTEMIFHCPIEDCQHESCKKCGKAPHIPLKCEEVEKVKHQDEGRLKVEEAISAAKIRTCPKCKTSFVKSDGCNKMSCRCGAKVCYICRMLLQGRNPYTHFCQTPHCDHKNCNKCTLYSNDEEDDRRAMREAGVTAATEFKEGLSTNGGSVPADDINIDVDTILHAGDTGKKARKGRGK